MDKKYCPLSPNFDYCTREKCEWWNIKSKKCAITLITKYLKELVTFSNLKNGKEVTNES